MQYIQILQIILREKTLSITSDVIKYLEKYNLEYFFERNSANDFPIVIDNKKLVTFIEQKDLKIKELEKEYTDKLKNVPKDSCGDSKPSADLLKYLRKNVQ